MGRTTEVCRAFCLAVVTALALPVAAGASAGAGHAPRALSVRIGPAYGPAVRPGFLGLSVEYFSALSYFGADPDDLNPTFIQLVRNLDPGQSPVLRIGGDSTDWTWWPVPGESTPPWARLSIGAQWASVVHAVAAELNARLILGIQFEADDSTVAGDEASDLLQAIGAPYVARFELGNEPEYYNSVPWYSDGSGNPVFGRPAEYDPQSYLSDFDDISDELPLSIPFAGPAIGPSAYTAAIPQLIEAEPTLTTVTIHRYALGTCASDSLSPLSAASLLTPGASGGLASSVKGPAREAHAAGDLLRVDELNSIPCGGDFAVSNSFAASLWSLNTLFALVKAGADGVNIQSFSGAGYAPFAFTDSADGWQANAFPLYYGMLAFAHAAPPGSRLLAVHQPAKPTLRSWATRDPAGTERITLINDSPKQAETISLAALPGGSPASVTDLTGPSLEATGGVTLGGQAITANSHTGLMSGRSTVTELDPAGCHYVAQLPAASAEIITIPAACVDLARCGRQHGRSDDPAHAVAASTVSRGCGRA